MVGFLGTEILYEQNFDPQKDFLISGTDDTANLIRENSLNIGMYSPFLRRDFSRFSAFDSDTRIDNVSLLLGDSSMDFLLPIIYIGGHVAVPYLGCSVSEANNLGVLPAEHTIWYVGCRNYTSDEEYWVRYNQRLLHRFELDLDIALKTAVCEMNGTPCRIIFNIDVIDPVWAPSVKCVYLKLCAL